MSRQTRANAKIGSSRESREANRMYFEHDTWGKAHQSKEAHTPAKRLGIPGYLPSTKALTHFPRESWSVSNISNTSTNILLRAFVSSRVESYSIFCLGIAARARHDELNFKHCGALWNLFLVSLSIKSQF